MGVVLSALTMPQAVALTCYVDRDGDGYGSDNIADSITTDADSCLSLGGGYITFGGDCDDDNYLIYPGAIDDTMDGIDQNCDGIDGIEPPPTDEAPCDGAVGAGFGLCTAYCEAMDCDGDDPQASPTACEKVLNKYKRLFNDELPLCIE